MKKRILLLLAFTSYPIFSLAVKIGDVVAPVNHRENQLIGYGLVVGLPQTGDSKSLIGNESLKKYLAKYNLGMDNLKIRSKNIAAVMVMAKLPPVARGGEAIDVWVSSLGDATSLKSGYLLQTPLKAANGDVYAVAQGPISYGENKKNNRGQKSRNTVFIPAAAIVERTLIQNSLLKEKNQIIFPVRLKTFTYKNASEIKKTINKKFPNSANIKNDGTINIIIPPKAEAPSFIVDVFALEVDVETRARVVISPREGTIVMGGNITISPVSISKDGLRVEVKDSLSIDGNQKQSSFFLKETNNVKSLVDTLNQLGLESQQIIEILQALHKAGALHAELIIL